MGGSAFNSLPSGSFPRIPPPVYKDLKARLSPALDRLYEYVAVPIEDPEKTDHGDLDFIVCTPRNARNLPETETDTDTAVNVPHNQVQVALGAIHSIVEDGARTSNFAVLVERGAWSSSGCSEEEERAREAVESGEIFYQVDVHVCADKDDWDRVVYFHSYGDLGMIQGLVTRNVGLVLGVNGLKYPNPPHPTLILNQDFDRISIFFGWSSERRNAGFTSRQQIFEWVIESRFFDPKSFRTSGQGISRVKAQRTMYSDFVVWVNARSESTDMEEVKHRQERVRKEALIEFGRLEEVENYMREFEARKILKTTFNGSVVKGWTELGNNWRGVKVVMDMVRERHGGEEGLLQIYLLEGEEGLKERVMKAFQESGLSS
ncbi:hypothetical protein D9757_003542 [Collybiopsis confluens]|uniref:Uncharacterized protein n=1 Tax=Collybiopsis confluens TaxID=2823264 RepID=A0A8H5MCT8_9AGAR|nr:hypothetical protein D9757_003542 [Collybiopsis confluens]